MMIKREPRDARAFAFASPIVAHSDYCLRGKASFRNGHGALREYIDDIKVGRSHGRLCYHMWRLWASPRAVHIRMRVRMERDPGDKNTNLLWVRPLWRNLLKSMHIIS